MSQQNLELARAFTDAWNRGDVDAVLELCDPEFEYHTSGDFLGLDPVYRAMRASGSSSVTSAVLGNR